MPAKSHRFSARVAWSISFSLLIQFAFYSTDADAAIAPIRIMPLGDSLTAGGYNIDRVWYVGGGYRLHLWEFLAAERYNFDFVGSLSNGSELFADPEHEGYSGWKINEVDNVVGNSLVEYNPDVVLLLLGSNDLIRDFQSESAHLRLSALVRKILNCRKDLRLFVSSVITTNNFAINFRIQSFNKKLAREVASLQKTNANLYWVDMYNDSQISGSPADLTDGVHPTDLGYKKMATVWFNALTAAQVFAAPSSDPIFFQQTPK